MSRIYTGIEVLREREFDALVRRRVGVLTNPSAVDSNLNSTLDILRSAPRVNVTALFAPEHGIHGMKRDGEHIASGYDERLGLFVHSLYGASLRPTREMLDGLDVIVCDIQDIGARYYTFLWTLSYLIEAAGEFGVPVIILDRPNPLGDSVRGGILQPECSSLVGRFPIPIQHGMTIGEIAQMINALWLEHHATLEIIPCAGLRRWMMWEDTGLPFVPPSPAMAHLVTAQHYPGACLVEGIIFSEGRGTALPFEITGAPGVNGEALAQHLNALGWRGVRFRPHGFVPTANKFAGEICEGVQAHITDPKLFDPVTTWLGVIRELHHFAPELFGWRTVENGSYPFDRLIGNLETRPTIDEGATLAELTDGWETTAAVFRKQRESYLLYE